MRSHHLAHAAFVLALILLVNASVFAQMDTFVEDFSTTDFMDPVATTALWDTNAGEIKLHPFQPSIVGNFNGSGTTQDIVIAYTKAFLANGAGGLVVVDLTDPTAPALVGSYDTGGDATALALAGDFAFVADGAGGVVVVDITNLGAPTLAGSFATSGVATGIAVDGDHAFVAAGSDGLLVLDISDPTTPVLVGSLVTTSDALDVAISGDQAFVAAGNLGLLVLDISDPVNPTLNGSAAAAGPALAVDVSGDFAMVAAGNSGLMVVNVTDMANPTLLGSVIVPGSAVDLSIDGDLVQVAAGNGGLVTVGTQNPNSPTVLNVFGTPGSATGVFVSGVNAYVADGVAGLQVIEARTLITPLVWGSLTSSGHGVDIEIAGAYAFVVNGSDLEVVDISDPALPLTAGTIDVGGTAHEITLAGNHAYLANGLAGLVVVDISDPISPAVAGSITVPGGEALGVSVDGNLAYVALDEQGLAVFDVSDPTTPTLVGQYNPALLVVLDVSVAGNLAYLACGEDGMQVVDISNPTNPTLVSSLNPFGDFYADGSVVEGDLALAVGVFGGSFYLASLVDITDPTLPADHGGAIGFGLGSVLHDVIAEGSSAFAVWGEEDGDPNGGFIAFDCTDPTVLLPTMYTTSSTPEAARSLALAGDYVYLTGDFGLQIHRLYSTRFLTEPNVAQSLPLVLPDVASVRLTTTQTGSITWNVGGGVATPGAWMAVPLFADSLVWKSTHFLTATGENSVCSHLELEFLYSYATIDSVADVPNDQGGWARIHFSRSGRDFGNAYPRIEDYVMWRRIDAEGGKIVPMNDDGSAPVDHDYRLDFPSLPLVENAGRYFLSSNGKSLEGFPPGTWEILGSFPALQQEDYIYLTPTQADSTAAGPAHSVHLVTAHASGEFWVSAPDSGSSKDNIAPGVPQGFQVDYSGSGNSLSWQISEANDFQYFNVYRSTAEGFTPGSENLVHSLAETNWADPVGEGWPYHYLVTALDFAGNESDPAAPASVSAVEGPTLPNRLAVFQNSPNPFNPMTIIRYELPNPSPIRLKIYDLTGRLVRTLIDGEVISAGRHQSVWNGKDNAGRIAAAGIYCYRFEAGGFVETRRMTLLK
jgi:hypothetical protein